MTRSTPFKGAACSAVMLAGTLVSASSALAGGLPGTGQTAAYQADKNDGIPGPVDVPDDGTLQRGPTPKYKVEKDGTVKDSATGLFWEVKCTGPTCAPLHNVANTYVWSGNGTQETIWDWLDAVNAEAGTGYAGHHDWRIPNRWELQSLVDHARISPCIDPIFGPTSPSITWSSTTIEDVHTNAWYVNFNLGNSFAVDKGSLDTVRAVRGGKK